MSQGNGGRARLPRLPSSALSEGHPLLQAVHELRPQLPQRLRAAVDASTAAGSLVSLRDEQLADSHRLDHRPVRAPPAGGESLALGLAVVALDRVLLRAPTEEGAPRATRVVLSFVLLAWGPFLAFHLGHVPGLANLRLATRKHSWNGKPGPIGAPVMRQYLIYVQVRLPPLTRKH